MTDGRSGAGTPLLSSEGFGFGGGYYLLAAHGSRRDVAQVKLVGVICSLLGGLILGNGWLSGLSLTRFGGGRLDGDDEILLLGGVGHSLYRLLFHLGAIGLGRKDLVDKLRLAAQLLERELGGELLALLLAVALAVASVDALDNHAVVKHRATVAVDLLAEQFKTYVDPVLLTPFEELALEVHLFISQLVDVNHLAKDTLLHEVHTSLVTLVEIDGTDECFKSVAAQIAVVRGTMTVGENELIDAHLLRQLVEGVTLNEFGTGIGKKSLALAGEMMVHDVAHNGIENGIAEKLEPLVVDGLALAVAVHDALVHERHLVVVDMAGIKAENGV